ncbi:MAG: DNA polymerase III subunit delta, partial [Candidatus Nealsonbacteria bacterium]|nr:DNA polymerase III subunit delta [Candidatus Nealsonbacteria bacterium]
MLIFLYGPDSFRSRQKLSEIIEENQKAHQSGLSLRVIECAESDFSEFKQSLETISMFESKKLIILKGALTSSSFEKALTGYQKELLAEKKDNIVFYESGEVDRRKSLFKFLLKNSKPQEFSFLEGGDLREWVKKEFEKYDAVPDSRAVETLILYCGNDSWRLYNEIKKISVRRWPDVKTKISEKDIAGFIKSDAEIGIFSAIEAISAKNKKTAFSSLHSLLEKGESPLYLLSMINYQFCNLVLVKDLLERKTQYPLIAKIANLHP